MSTRIITVTYHDREPNGAVEHEVAYDTRSEKEPGRRIYLYHGDHFLMLKRKGGDQWAKTLLRTMARSLRKLVRRGDDDATTRQRARQ